MVLFLGALLLINWVKLFLLYSSDLLRDKASTPSELLPPHHSSLPYLSRALRLRSVATPLSFGARIFGACPWRWLKGETAPTGSDELSHLCGTARGLLWAWDQLTCEGNWVCATVSFLPHIPQNDIHLPFISDRLNLSTHTAGKLCYWWGL